MPEINESIDTYFEWVKFVVTNLPTEHWPAFMFMCGRDPSGLSHDFCIHAEKPAEQWPCCECDLHDRTHFAVSLDRVECHLYREDE